jgi:hypothetical protein
MIHQLNDIIEAHGAINRWNQFSKIEAEIVSGGKLFELKGVPQDASARQMTVWLHEQRASVYPFGSPNQRSSFTPGRVAIEALDGKLIAERTGTPNEIHEHLKAPKWDPLDRAYFNGYALWMYLTTPFFMLLPGMEVREIDPLQEGEETWKGLSVSFPPHIATHSAVQNFYFGKDNLIRRHDYHLDAGNFYAAQYISGLKEVQGILVASKRRAYRKDGNGKPLLDELMVGIDLNNFHLS